MPSESSFGSSDYSQTQLTAKVRWSSTLARLARLLTEQGYPEDSSRRHLRHHCRPQLAAKNLTDLTQRSAPAQHIGGEGMPKQMRSFKIGVQPGTLECPTNDATDGREAKAAQRRLQPNEECACRANGADITQVVNQGFANVLR